MLCNSIWLWQGSKRQQKPCLSSLVCPIKQQASFHWDSPTTTARDKPMPLCPSSETLRDISPQTHLYEPEQKQNTSWTPYTVTWTQTVAMTMGMWPSPQSTGVLGPDPTPTPRNTGNDISYGFLQDTEGKTEKGLRRQLEGRVRERVGVSKWEQSRYCFILQRKEEKS